MAAQCPRCVRQATEKPSVSAVVTDAVVTSAGLAGSSWAFFLVSPWPLRAWFALQVVVVVIAGVVKLASTPGRVR